MPKQETLTRREFQVLQGLRAGKQSKVIGRELGISEKTVKANVTSILKKLQCQNRTQAAVKPVADYSHLITEAHTFTGRYYSERRKSLEQSDYADAELRVIAAGAKLHG